MERKIWLENSIEDYVKSNPGRDSVDICTYFKLRADITMDSLGKLVDDGKVIRKHYIGSRYGYIHTGK